MDEDDKQYIKKYPRCYIYPSPEKQHELILQNLVLEAYRPDIIILYSKFDSVNGQVLLFSIRMFGLR